MLSIKILLNDYGGQSINILWKLYLQTTYITNDFMTNM